MRMRSIEAAHAELLARDPGCELTKTALRRFVVSGRIPSVRLGSGGNAKYLLDADALEENLFRAVEPEPVPVGKLRRLEVL